MSTPSFTAASTAAAMPDVVQKPIGPHALYMATLALGATPLAVPLANSKSLAPGTSEPAAVDATCVPCPSLSLGDWKSWTSFLPGNHSVCVPAPVPAVKVLAPTSLLLHMLALNRSPSTHRPFQLGRTGVSPMSLKLALSGQMPLSTKPMMTPSPKSVSGQMPESLSRPRKAGDLVVCRCTALSLNMPVTPGVFDRRRASSTVSSAAKPCITVSYTYKKRVELAAGEREATVEVYQCSRVVKLDGLAT